MSKITPLRFGQLVRDTIEQGWCQHTSAKDDNGLSCSLFSEEATRFCLVGAVERCTAGDVGRIKPATEFENAMRSELKVNFLSSWNDSLPPKSGKKTVLRAIDKALARLA